MHAARAIRIGLALALGSAGAAPAADELLLRQDGELLIITNIPDGRTASRVPRRGAPGAASHAVSRPLRAADLPPSPYDVEIALAAADAGLSPHLVKAVAFVESGLDANAVSPKGALGLMQLMPETARMLGVRDAFDPRQNLRGGARYLREQLERFGGDLRLALAAYNAGPGTVLRAGDVPNYPETRRYVSRVYARLDGMEPGAAPVVTPGAATRPTARKRSAGPPAVRMRVAADGTVRLEN